MAPAAPRSQLAGMVASERTSEERQATLRRQALLEHNTLVVRLDDRRLTWAEREILAQLATRLYSYSVPLNPDEVRR